MIFYTRYSNSFLATFVSGLGGAAFLTAIMSIVAGLWPVAAVFALLGVGLRLWAKFISERKEAKRLEKESKGRKM